MSRLPLRRIARIELFQGGKNYETRDGRDLICRGVVDEHFDTETDGRLFLAVEKLEGRRAPSGTVGVKLVTDGGIGYHVKTAWPDLREHSTFYALDDFLREAGFEVGDRVAWWVEVGA